MTHFRRLAIALVVALLASTGASLVLAASPPPAPGLAQSAEGALVSLTSQQAQAISDSVKPTEASRVWAGKHHMQGTVTVLPMVAASRGMAAPYVVSIGKAWYGVWVYLTQSDVHAIWDLVWAAGISQAAASLCAPAGWLAIGCAIVGAVLAYVVAEAVWNYIGYYAPSCGVTIVYYWWNSWGRYGC